MLQVDRIDAIRKTGNSIGGVVECAVRNVPVSTMQSISLQICHTAFTYSTIH
jgi:chorismate synthase